MEPTIGLVPQASIVPVAHPFDSAGPMATTPYDLALVLDVIIKREPSDVLRNSYRTALIGTWDNIPVATLDSDVWQFSPDYLKSVDEATTQIVSLDCSAWFLLILAKNRGIRSAYAKIEPVARSSKGNVPLVLPKGSDFEGNKSELMVTIWYHPSGTNGS
jgi:amidase